MKTFTIYLLLTLFFACSFQISLFCQKYSGKWYGRAEAKAGNTYNTYLMELIILKKGNNITGELNYFFGQDEYKAKIKGIFFPATKTIELQPFKLITFFSRNPNGPDCLMDGSLTLYIDGKDTVLYGQLNPLPKHKLFCPLMEVNLHREVLQPVEEVEEEEEMVQETIEKVIPVMVVDKNVAVMAPLEVPVIKDTVARALVSELTGRSFIAGPLITVSTDTILLHLYDNGKIDNDTVSVFFNRQPVALMQGLSLKPVIIQLVLKPGENEIAMFAENLGEIPPNTALCIIYAGADRYDINLSSTLLTNGTVRIKRKD